MSNPWNPQQPNSPVQPSSPTSNPPTPNPSEPLSEEQPAWAAPSGSGVNWDQPPRSHHSTQQETTQHNAFGPPNDFEFGGAGSGKASGASGNEDGGGKIIKTGGAILLAITLMLGSGYAGAQFASDGDNLSSNLPASSKTSNTLVNNSSEPATQPFAKVAAAVQPSVVSIEVSLRGQPIDTGSGFIYKNDGTIATNNHVISAAANNPNANITVKFSNGDTHTATIVGRDPETDIAVIKVSDASNLTAATLGTTSNLHVGDSVLALGSPLGLDGSVASGIISALHRTVNLGSEDQNTNPFGGAQSRVVSTVNDAIQTDAAINPGNSGGPLVDMTGAVIGINTAIASLGSGTSSQSGSIGVGFAIPIDEVQSVAGQLIRGETPKHALLGVQILDDDKGALIQSVTSGGAASKAGIKEGDIVTKFDGKKITSADELSAAVRAKDPGDNVVIDYTRKGEAKSTTVTLGSSTD